MESHPPSLPQMHCPFSARHRYTYTYVLCPVRVYISVDILKCRYMAAIRRSLTVQLQECLVPADRESVVSGTLSNHYSNQSARMCHCLRNASRSSCNDSRDTPFLTTPRHFPSSPQMSLCLPCHRFPPAMMFFEAIF